MKHCPKCNSSHEKHGIFCSRKCANSRGPRSEEFKTKVKEKLLKPRIESICPECGKCFTQKKASNSQIFCNRTCKAKYTNRMSLADGVSKETKDKISLSRKNLFANGLLSVSGGRTDWIQYKNIKVQGSYELRTCVILDKWKDLGFIKSWEYTRDRITYTNSSGASATYLLDFKVQMNDNTFVYIETKGYIRENDELKWEACKSENLKLAVWFESNITNAEQIADVANVVLALS